MLQEEALETTPETFDGLSHYAKENKLNEIYFAIRSLLTSVGWIVGLFAPKVKKAIQVIVVALDAFTNYK